MDMRAMLAACRLRPSRGARGGRGGVVRCPAWPGPRCVERARSTPAAQAEGQVGMRIICNYRPAVTRFYACRYRCRGTVGSFQPEAAGQDAPAGERRRPAPFSAVPRRAWRWRRALRSAARPVPGLACRAVARRGGRARAAIGRAGRCRPAIWRRTCAIRPVTGAARRRRLRARATPSAAWSAAPAAPACAAAPASARAA